MKHSNICQHTRASQVFGKVQAFRNLKQHAWIEAVLCMTCDLHVKYFYLSRTLQSAQILTASEIQSAKEVQTCQLEEPAILQVSTMHAPYMEARKLSSLQVRLVTLP